MTKLNFKNKVILVTGGSSGIGSAIVHSFQGAAAWVVCVDVQSPQDPITQGRFIAADVSDFDQVRNCVEDVLSQEKTIDCLVNNAGISRDAVVWKMTEDQWDAVLDVNLKGAFNFIHHTAAHFKETKGGKIVNVSSINGMRGKFGLANYSAAKAGLIGLTKTVAKELGRYNVNVNAVAPGYVITPLTQQLSSQVMDAARDETVLGRLAAPADVANAVLFLCSDLARHITGEVIKVDGGQYI
jgi:NAD(P)-dependent dehydrogenase (short-subunit alcohol dehydrogenase family)